MRQGWGGNGLRAFYHGLSWSSFGGEPWGRRDKSYDLSEGKLISVPPQGSTQGSDGAVDVFGRETGTDSGQATFSTPLPTEASRAEEWGLSAVPK